MRRNFIIDLHPDHPNVWITGSGSAEAFKQGPVLGDYIAHRILGAPTDLAQADEFKLPTEQFEADAGAEGDVEVDGGMEASLVFGAA